MSRETWLSEDELEQKLNQVGVTPPSDRKRRLLACACARGVWHLLGNVRCRQAVEVAERFADGLASAQELTAARAVVQDILIASAGPEWQTIGSTWETGHIPRLAARRSPCAARCRRGGPVHTACEGSLDSQNGWPAYAGGRGELRP